MFDYDEPDNKVRCLLTELKNAVDAEHQDNMRDKADLQNRIERLEAEDKRKQQAIYEMRIQNETDVKTMFFMIGVACFTMFIAFVAVLN